MEDKRNQPHKTAVAPQKTAVAPQKTAVAPQKTAVAPGSLKPSNTAAAQLDSITVGGGKTYKVEKCMGSGTEGDIYVVADGAKRYALKRYHPGFRANMPVMPILQKLNGKSCISDIIDYAEDFELLEYAPEGSVAGVNIRGNAEVILAIAVKTAMCLNEMHRLGVIHKDIKPANILIKDKASWSCVLCDFGLADVLTEKGTVVTLQARTPVYAAPEVYKQGNTLMKEGEYFCELTPKADFYSLGMTILSLWVGEEAFLQQEQELAMDKTKGRITIPADMPDPLAKICRGLLISDPDKRWDFSHIRRQIMDGEDVPLEEEEEIDLNIEFNKSKDLIAHTPIELGEMMGADPELGTRYLYRGDVERWLKPYPELAIQMQDIVEKRYPKDQVLGHYAATCLLNPAMPFYLSGTARDSGEEIHREAITLQDVSDFCNDVIPDDNTADDLSSDLFTEWTRVRNDVVANNFPASEEYNVTSDVYMLRVQMIDPLADINLRNDTSHPDYAMTGESLGRFLNQVYNIYWNECDGDIEQLESVWNRPEHAPLNRQISANTVMVVAASFVAPEEYHYLTSFFNTKMRRFKDQMLFYIHATETTNEDYQEKAGPKDETFFAQSAWMKVIKGFGATPEYRLVDKDKTCTTLKEVFKENKKTLQNEYDNRGLRGFMAVCLQEDPTANLKPRFAYEKLLAEYVEYLAKIDDQMDEVVRFREAQKEASSLLGDGQGKIHKLMTRNILQYVLTLALAVVPALFLLVMLLFAIIDNPVIDTESMKLERYIWIVGLIIALGFYSKSADEDGGCLGSIILGGVLAVGLYFLVKFLGQYILYIFLVMVIAALVFFSLKTIFAKSQYAADARKFSKPGFDEKVLEPLYYAFSDDDEFDSSFNGAFNDDDIQNWKEDLRVRRLFILLFIGVVWLLMLFSLLVPKSGRFQRLTAPITNSISPLFNKVGATFDRWFPAPEPEEQAPTLGFESLNSGTQGEEVKQLQQFLVDHGYSQNTPDGDYGRRTVTAVKAFQKAAGLKQTGEADAETVKAMNAVLKEEFDNTKKE